MMLRLLATSLALSALAVVTPAQKLKAVAPQHKNVLIVVLDDLGTDKLSFYGETTPTCPPLNCDLPPNCPPPASGCVPDYPYTPNLEALRQQGILFRKAYVTPVCSPTRACIQTGRYGFRTGVGQITSTVQIPGDYGLPNSEKTLAELVKEGFHGASAHAAGMPFACGAFGKWHITSTLPQDYGHAVANGYDRFCGFAGNVGNFYRFNKIIHDKGSAPIVVNVDGRYTSPPFTDGTWQASETRRDALQWIGEQTGSFLAYVAFGPPHTPLQVPPLELLPSDTVCELACAGLAPGDFLTPADAPELVRLTYRAQVEAVDTEFGKLIDGLAPAVRANTMILVIGDNGSASFVVDDPPHDSFHAKGKVFDLGVRVPLLVAGPLVKQPVPLGGWESSALVHGVDLWRTVADITGADAASVRPLNELDSISFLPVIQDPLSAGDRTTVFSQLFEPNGLLEADFPPPSCYSINDRATTDGVYKYIRYQASLSSTPCGIPAYSEGLYYLPTDPEESVNLMSGTLSPADAAALAQLSGEMDALSGL